MDSGDDPWSSFRIDSLSPLEAVSERSSCPSCLKSRKYFCYTCLVPCSSLRGILPVVSLPLLVDVVKHPREIDGKSTAVHAAVLAPNDVTIHTFPQFPSYLTDGRVLLLYPSAEAVDLGEAVRSSMKPGGVPIERLVFVDSTWAQAKAIERDARLKALPRVFIGSHETLFWRYQRGKPKTHLSTIEAIYYALLTFQQATREGGIAAPDHSLDNLLFLFKFMYEKVTGMYGGKDRLLAYQPFPAPRNRLPPSPPSEETPS